MSSQWQGWIVLMAVAIFVVVGCGEGNVAYLNQNSGQGAGEGDQDGTGDGESSGQSCRVTSVIDNGDGTYTVTCSGVEVVVVADSESGGDCEVINHGDGSYTISCDSGSVLVPSDENGGDCTVTDNENNTHTISCEDESEVIVTSADPDGDGGETSGDDTCEVTSVTNNGDGTYTVVCSGEEIVVVADTENGGSCEVVDHGDGSFTMTCQPGAVLLPDDENGGDCTVTGNANGTHTISCDDGSEVVVTGVDPNGGGGDGDSLPDSGDFDGSQGCVISDVEGNPSGSQVVFCDELGPVGTIASGNGCTVEENADGTVVISCDDGSGATIPGGAGGDSECEIVDNFNGTYTITCDDGSEVVVSEGGGGFGDGDGSGDGDPVSGGSGCPINDVTDNNDDSYTLECTGLDVLIGDSDDCTIIDNGNGSYTIECNDGSSVTVPDGQNGDCSLIDNGNGTFTITCDDGSTVIIPGTGVDPEEEITPIGDDGDADPGYGGIPDDASTGKFCAEPMSLHEGTHCGGPLAANWWQYGGKWIGHSACVDHDFRLIFDEPGCEPSHFTEFEIDYAGESVFRRRWWWWWSWNAGYRARLEADLEVQARVEVPSSCTDNFGGCITFNLALRALYPGVDVNCLPAANDMCDCRIEGNAQTFTGGWSYQVDQRYGGIEVYDIATRETHEYSYCTNWENRTMDLLRTPPQDVTSTGENGEALDVMVYSQRLRWVPFSQCTQDNHCHQNYWFFGGSHYCNLVEQCVPYCSENSDCFDNEICVGEEGGEDDEIVNGKCELQ